MATSGARPHGVLKTKPTCPDCKAILVEDSEGSPNSRVHSTVSEAFQFVVMYCANCQCKLPFFITERVVRYWENGGLRLKPGRKPKMASAESAA